MTIIDLLFFVAGLVLLIVGAEGLVRGASRLAAAVGVSPLVIGLTVVAYGTSAPEMAVSVQSALNGQVNIALGNVVGSNIFNVLLILGISAMIAPLVVSRQLIRRDVPLMIAVSLGLLGLGLDGVIGRGDGLIFLLGGITYTVWSIYESRRENQLPQESSGVKPPHSAGQLALQFGYLLGGLGLLVLGSNWLVDGAVIIAQYLGVSEMVIGLTIIAAGTSLPEVATSIIASLRGERDIAVGNVVGSNIFNILIVLGLSASVAPAGLPVPASALSIDLPIMVAVAFVCLPIFFTGGKIARWEGALLLGYYGAYTAYLLLSATASHWLDDFNSVMLGVIVPFTALLLIISVIQSVRALRLNPHSQ